MTDQTCLVGCTYRGQHAPGCGCATAHDDQHDGHCTGCEPRETDTGNLCTRCWGNLQRDIRTAPALVRWIREHVDPAAQPLGDRVHSGEIDAPAPLNLGAVDDADALHAMLASWALLVLEEHPANLVATRPRAQRRTVDGSVVGIRSGTVTTTLDPDKSEPQPKPTDLKAVIPNVDLGPRCDDTGLPVLLCHDHGRTHATGA